MIQRILTMAATAALVVASVPSASAADAAPPSAPVTREAVDELVGKLVKRLWAAQLESGRWEKGDPPRPNRQGEFGGNGVSWYGGASCAALLALHIAGEDEQDPRFQKGLAGIVELPGNATYLRGMRAMLYARLKDEKYRKLLHADARYLGKGIAESTGHWGYKPATAAWDRGDSSNTQYGFLGIWVASDRGFEVRDKFWQLLEKTYLGNQCDDGGWTYRPDISKKSGYGSMTAAAIANLYVIWENLYVSGAPNCKGRVNPELVKAIERGQAWMAKHFRPDDNPHGWGHNRFYYYHTLERVGVASGLKYFGEHDWYRQAAGSILAVPPPADNIVDTAFALMFLCYGRAPVAFNKLKYDGGWNDHPRDLAMLCRYLQSTYEHHFNWQIMPIDAPAQDFHDAPILALSGSAALRLTDPQIARLRGFLDRGGTLFGEAIDNSHTFRLSFANLCRQLYPHSELAPLDREHPLFSAHFKLRGTFGLQGVSDGVRTPVIFSPVEISCDWQRLNIGRRRDLFELGANLVQFASDGGQLWSKEESYWPRELGNKAAKTVAVGRLIHGGADNRHVWDPTRSAGWQRLDILSRNTGGFGIRTVAVDAANPIDPTEIPVLHLTGIGKVNLGENEQRNLKTYVQAGGLLLADAAGGREAFDASFRRLAGEMFGPEALVPLPPQPWLAAAADGGEVWYRHRERLPRARRALEMLGVKADGDRWNVYYFPSDLTYALNGAPATEPVGLAPDSAGDVALEILKSRIK